MARNYVIIGQAIRDIMEESSDAPFSTGRKYLYRPGDLGLLLEATDVHRLKFPNRLAHRHRTQLKDHLPDSRTQRKFNHILFYQGDLRLVGNQQSSPYDYFIGLFDQGEYRIAQGITEENLLSHLQPVYAWLHGRAPSFRKFDVGQPNYVEALELTALLQFRGLENFHVSRNTIKQLPLELAWRGISADWVHQRREETLSSKDS